MVFIIPIFLLINLWIFMPFFGLGLFGDDWLTIFRYFYYIQDPKHLGPFSTNYFNQFTYFLNSYGPQDTIMALLYKMFGEQSSVYFIISYILRVGAGFTLYFPALYITKNKLAAYFAVFFLFSATGLEASSWVFNMPSYLAIIFFNFLLYFYLRFHTEKRLKYLLLSYLFFTLTFISTPIRAHGLIPFIIFVEIFFLIIKGGWKSLKLNLFRIVGFFLIFLLIYFLGFKESISGTGAGGLSIGFNNILQLLSTNRFDFLFYPITTIGSMLIPDFFLSQGFQITSFSQYIFKIFLPIFFIYMIIIIILNRSLKNISSNFFYLSAISAIFWTIIVAFIYKSNLETFSNSQYVSLLLIGGYFLCIVFTIFALLRTNFLIKSGLIIALGWTVISFFYPWWTNPHFIYLTTHRYLIISSTGMSLLFATIVGLGKNSKTVVHLFIIGSVFLLLNALSTRNYIEKQYRAHNRETVNKIWSQMPHIPQLGKTDKPLIFYFEGDATNGDILHDAVTFGFPFHIGLMYNLTEENELPLTMDSWEEVVSAVTDGESFIKYIGKAIDPVPIDNVYVLKLEGKDNLINLTETARQKLKQIK